MSRRDEVEDGMGFSGLVPSKAEMAEAAAQHRQAQRLANAEACAGAYRESLEKILKAFANQGASAVFTMANIAREALR